MQVQQDIDPFSTEIGIDISNLHEADINSLIDNFFSSSLSV